MGCISGSDKKGEEGDGGKGGAAGKDTKNATSVGPGGTGAAEKREPEPAAKPAAQPAADPPATAGEAGTADGKADAPAPAPAAPEKPDVSLTAKATGDMQSNSGPMTAEVSWTGLTTAPEGREAKDFCGVYKRADVSAKSNKDYVSYQKIKPESHPDGSASIDMTKMGLSKGTEYEVRICRCYLDKDTAHYDCLARHPITVTWA